MYQAYKDSTAKGRSFMNAFGGLNQNENCGENEFRTMSNLSSDAYPYLTQRAARSNTLADLRDKGEMIAVVMPGFDNFECKIPIGEAGTFFFNLPHREIYTYTDFYTGKTGKFVARFNYVVYFLDKEGWSMGLYKTFAQNSFYVTVPRLAKQLVVRAEPEGGWPSGMSKKDVIIYASARRVQFRSAVMHLGQMAMTDGRYVWLGGEDLADLWELDQYLSEEYYWDCNLLSYGTELILMPHGLAIDTSRVVNPIRKLGAKWEIKTGTSGIFIDKIVFSMCDAGGNAIDYTASAAAPESPVDGQYWLDTSEETHRLNKWSASSKMWVGVATSYIKMTVYYKGKYSEGTSLSTISADMDAIYEKFDAFVEGDGVKVAGLEGTDLKDVFPKETYSIIKKTGSEELISADFGDYGTFSYNPLYIIFPGIIDREIEITNDITISRDIPAMDHYVVSKNRIWGCVNDGKVNEIRCCKLGDPANWNVFTGVSTDSYTATVGIPGPFTGAVNYEDVPYFFKEESILKIYGDYPAAYQLYTYSQRGLQRGSPNGVAICDGYMFFKSAYDFCIFDGSRVQSISQKLGKVNYDCVVAGVLGKKVYFSCLERETFWKVETLLVYDSDTGLWHREKDGYYFAFLHDNGDMWGVNDTYVVYFPNTPAGEGERTEWFAETGLIGLDTPDQKAISHYTVRLNMEVGATMSILASYDEGEFEHLFTCVGEGKIKTHTFSARPIRCDNLRLRLEGVGKCTVYSIAYTTEQRSDKP